MAVDRQEQASDGTRGENERWSELMLGHLDQRLDEAEFTELQSQLQASPEARSQFVKLSRLDAGLRDESCAAIDEPPSVIPISLPASLEHQKSRQVWLIAAAIVALALVTGLLLRKGNEESNTGSFSNSSSPETAIRGVAVITAESAAIWDSKVRGRLGEGSPLPPGRLVLEAGLAQIDFYGGASISLSGPAELELIDGATAILHRGRIRADVPPAARGFEIRAADMRIEDLGTSFGLSVTDDNRGEVIVFDGEVRTIARSGEILSLFQGDAAQLHDGKARQNDAGEIGDFPTIAKIIAGSGDRDETRYAAWRQSSLERRSDPRLIAYFDFEGLTAASRRLANRATARKEAASELDGGIVGARVAPGRWSQKSALDFRLEGDRVRFQIPGEFDALTLYAWVRIDALDRHLNSLFLTNYYDPNEIHWQMSGKGALHFATSPMGVEDLEKHNRRFYSKEFWQPGMSGQWILLATTVDRSAGSDQRVVHYINGKAVGFSGGTNMKEDLPKMRIGSADLGNWSDPIWPDVSIRTLNGRIDEFALFAVALSAEEIETIYQQGKP